MSAPLTPEPTDRVGLTSAPHASTTHPGEGHSAKAGARLNWLRAGVLGANDGIVAVSGLVIGVAASGAEHSALFTAGMAGLASGALSMAVGEYVSVSTQRDTEMALLEKERGELADDPEAELAELTGLYQAKGLEPDLAHQVAVQLTAHDALGAHAAIELGIDHEELTSPMQAAVASMAAFIVGALIPLLAMLLLPADIRIWATVVAAAAALVITGILSARLGGARVLPAVVRNAGGGLLAMAITYGIGHLVGANIA